jgi:hypothetical protein
MIGVDDAYTGPQTIADPQAVERAEKLKERVYVTFTAIAVVLALAAHEVSPGRALVVLVITLLGTVVAVFFADVVSHLAVHAQLPDAHERRHMMRVSFGAFAVVLPPIAFLLLAQWDIWSTETALRASSYALLLTLIAISYVAVHRITLPLWQKLLVLFGEFVLGSLVIVLELLAHAL